jgi:ADP-ribose pyrophosphatase YjhB (NUDIX family)
MPRFCSACGAAIDAPAPLACTQCGTAHWLKASPAAAALVVHDGKLLLVRRAHDPWNGSWCAPSGFCDGDEHPIECAEREAFEEAGIRIRVIGYLGHWISEYATAPGIDVEPVYCAVSYYHAVPIGDATPTADDVETSAAVWFAPDELPAELAPPVTAAQIYGAWRDAIIGGRTETPLPDRPATR